MSYSPESPFIKRSRFLGTESSSFFPVIHTLLRTPQLPNIKGSN